MYLKSSRHRAHHPSHEGKAPDEVDEIGGHIGNREQQGNRLFLFQHIGAPEEIAGFQEYRKKDQSGDRISALVDHHDINDRKRQYGKSEQVGKYRVRSRRAGGKGPHHRRVQGIKVLTHGGIKIDGGERGAYQVDGKHNTDDRGYCGERHQYIIEDICHRRMYRFSLLIASLRIGIGLIIVVTGVRPIVLAVVLILSVVVAAVLAVVLVLTVIIAAVLPIVLVLAVIIAAVLAVILVLPIVLLPGILIVVVVLSIIVVWLLFIMGLTVIIAVTLTIARL